MKKIEDEAIVLNKQDKGTNVLLTLFTKTHGKIYAIVYGIRNSKKREQAAILPMSISEFEFKEQNGSYSVSSVILKRYNKNSMKNIYKLKMGLYVVHVLSQITNYEFEDSELYETNLEILDYIENLETEIIDSKFTIYIYITYLRRIMINLGIFDLDAILSNNTLQNDYEKYVKYIRNNEIIDEIGLRRILSYFERYINNYFNINIDYKKIYME